MNGNIPLVFLMSNYGTLACIFLCFMFFLPFTLLFYFNLFIIHFQIASMNFRSNYTNNLDYYGQSNNLGYSNVSRNFNRMHSPKNGHEQHTGGFGELQYMLENQRKKFREAKDRFESDLDNERKKRIEFQNKLIKLKDEFSRKQVALSEAQFKINNLLHENQDITVENNKLKNELARLEEVYGGRIQQLETQLSLQTKNFEETTLQYNEQFDKFKKQGQEYVQHLTFETDRKIKALEEKLKAVQMVKRDLTVENKKINDLIISNRLQFEEQIRDIKNRARDQEIKKAQYLTKSFEQKIKMVEDTKEGLNRKIQQLARVIQERQSKINEIESLHQDECTKLTQDRADFEEQVNELGYIVNKLKMELAEKDSMIGRSVNNNEGEIKMLRQQLQSKKQQIVPLQSTIRDLRMALKDTEAQGERKRKQLSDRCYSVEAQARRYKEEYTRLAEILKSKINSTIDNISYPRRDK